MSYNHKEYMKEYRQRPEVKAKKRESDRLYRERNREVLKERRKEYDATYYAKNPGFRAKHCAKRRAMKLNATPSWSDDELNSFIIEEAYSLSRLRSDCTKREWSVDHIIPLNNTLVCGLHVGLNLQVIPAIENSIKSNKFIS